MNDDEQELWRELAKSRVPEHIHHAIVEFVMRGKPTGGFLRAVFSNNLRESVAQADDKNLEHLVDVVRFCYNHVPGPAWGSPEAVTAWIAQGGLLKVLKEETHG